MSELGREINRRGRELKSVMNAHDRVGYFLLYEMNLSEPLHKRGGSSFYRVSRKSLVIEALLEIIL